MAAELWPSLPAWLGSQATWFLILNVLVAAIAVLSSRARPSSASPRSGGGVRVTRRASSSSVLLQRLRSFSIFSYPSACFDDDTTTLQQHAQATEEEEPSAMSMEDAYALVMASRRPPEPEPERRSDDDVDDKAEEFIRRFEDDNERQQRLNSIFNYTQMLKQRALGTTGRGQPDAQLEHR